MELELLDCSCEIETTEGNISKQSVQRKGCPQFFLSRSKCLLVSNIYKVPQCCLENGMPFRNRNNNRFDISLTLKSNSNEEQYGLSDAGFYFRNSVKLMILLIPHIKEKHKVRKKNGLH